MVVVVVRGANVVVVVRGANNVVVVGGLTAKVKAPSPSRRATIRRRVCGTIHSGAIGYVLRASVARGATPGMSLTSGVRPFTTLRLGRMKISLLNPRSSLPSDSVIPAGSPV